VNNQFQKTIDPAVIISLADYYRQHLLEDVMPFWETRTGDRQCGGYLTCFDRQGTVTNNDKYIWLQGRQLWMFSALYTKIETRPEWLALAKLGRDFLIKHAYAGNGRWNFHLSRDGTAVKEGTISIYTDHFVLAGLCEYAVASGREEDLDLIRTTYDTMERNVHNPDFKDIFHQKWSPRYKRHGVYMISLHTANIASQVLGDDKTRPLRDHCLEQILHVFAKDEHEQLFESVGRNGEFIDEPEGRLINPGHALESMWFCMEEGRRRRDVSIIQRALQIADWAYRAGYDRDYGGIVSFLDCGGKNPLRMDWHKETGMLWHDKSFWVHAEALCALAFATIESGSTEWFQRFENLHQWCRDHFYDAEYGEWFTALWRDGRPKDTAKGSNWKAAYHVPRALMKIALAFENNGN
jgi:N-acylglucosamine 2-epimerase